VLSTRSSRYRAAVGASVPLVLLVLLLISHHSQVTNLEQGLDKDETKSNDDSSLMRFEWVEIIIRLGLWGGNISLSRINLSALFLVPLPGIAKFFESGFTNDPSNAIELLCNNHILPHLEVAAVHQRNDFRRFRLYNQPVDDVLKRNKRTLEYMFRNCCCLKQSKDVCMDMKEWVSLLTHLGVIDNDFTKREARLCFCWSKMRVADEVKRELAWTTMTFFDFLEALCRVSELKSFPTDAQLEAGGRTVLRRSEAPTAGRQHRLLHRRPVRRPRAVAGRAR
jgi:hypothetical protein